MAAIDVEAGGVEVDLGLAIQQVPISDAELDATLAAAVGNPETATSDAVGDVVTGRLTTFIPPGYIRPWPIGTNLATARPAGYSGPVEWVITSTLKIEVPVYVQNGDLISYVAYSPVPWSPLQLPGIAAWYDAQTLALTDGAAVASWPDLSGLARHMLQATGTAQPTFRAAGVAGKPSVQFDGTTDWLTAAIASYIGAWTVYLVGQSLPASIVTSSDFFYDGSSAALAAQRLGLYRSTANVINANRGTGFAGAALDNAPHRIKTVFNGASSSVAIDAGAATTGTTSLGGVDVVKLALGARADGANFLDGHICEAVFVQGAVAAGDDTKMTTYLQGKWGVA